MTEESQLLTNRRYKIDSSDTSQDADCSVCIDLIVSPAVHIGAGLADFLYGEGGRGEMQLNTLYQDPGGGYTHIELRTSPKRGRLIYELFVMMERLEQYLNEIDKSDPEQVRRMRYLLPVNREAESRHMQTQAH